jgi:hypothetical protein
MINNMKLNQELNSASVVYSKENLGKSTKFYFCLTNLAYRERRKQLKTKYARIRERKKKEKYPEFHTYASRLTSHVRFVNLYLFKTIIKFLQLLKK